MLQAENIRSARCSQVVLSKLLAVRNAIFFISARARKKIAVLGMLATARKDHSSSLKLTAEISDPETVFLDTVVYKGTRFKENSILDVKTHF